MPNRQLIEIDTKQLENGLVKITMGTAKDCRGPELLASAHKIKEKLFEGR